MNVVKRCIIGLCVTIIIAPIIINFIVGLNHLNNTVIVGSATDWLSFYGSYLGSGIASLGSFVILYFTIKNSRQVQKLNTRHQEIVETVKDLSQRFDIFMVSEVIHLSKVDNPTKDMLLAECSRLQQIRDKYSALHASAYLLYYDDYRAHLFLEEYSKVLHDLINVIDELIIFYSSHLVWDDECKKCLLLFSTRINKISEENFSVLQLAHDYISSITEEYQKEEDKL